MLMMSKKFTEKACVLCYNRTHMKIPITQSKEWQKLQEDLGETSFIRTGKDYHYLAIKKHTPFGDYLYCPYGPVASNLDSLKESLKSLNELAREEKVIFIRIEPQDPDFKTLKIPKSRKTKDLSPADTWALDLTEEKPTIISNFSQGTRTRYNTFAKKGLVVEKTNDLDQIKHLVSLQKQLFQKKHLVAYGEKYLKTELAQPFATLYLVKYQPSTSEEIENMPAPGQVLAASLFFDYDGTRYYMQSAADANYKKLPATVALLTTAIFDAKEQGIKTFDFWGIAPDGAPKDHPWAGFTEFKKSFGGFAKHYAGTYDIVLSPTKYRLYNSAHKIKRLAKK